MNIELARRAINKWLTESGQTYIIPTQRIIDNIALYVVMEYEPLIEALEQIASHLGTDDSSYDEWTEAKAFQQCKGLAQITLNKLKAEQNDTTNTSI